MVRRKRSTDDFAEEIQSHLELETEALKRAGLSEEAARQKAKSEFGSVSVARERFNLRGRAVWLENLVRDGRFAVRQLLKNPGFTATAVLVMALGIGTSVAIFAFVDAALIKPLPYESPSRLVNLFESNLTGPRFHLSYLDYLDWKRMNSVFSSMSVYEQSDFMLNTPQGTRQVDGVRVSDGFLRTLGVQPLLGRDFRDGEDLTSASSTVLLTYAEWQNRYGGRPDIVGQSVILNGTTATIVGVLPRDFHFAPAAPGGFWLTIVTNNEGARQRGSHGLLGVARLKDGVTLAAADAEMKTVAERLEKQYPDTNRNRDANVISLTDMIVGDVRPILMVLLSGAGLLLLIASLNVASLLLVRTENRRREIALRGALGAHRDSIHRMVLREAGRLAIVGIAIGLVFSVGAGSLMRGLLFGVRSWDASVLCAVVGVLAAAALLASYLPARRAASVNPMDALRAE